MSEIINKLKQFKASKGDKDAEEMEQAIKEAIEQLQEKDKIIDLLAKKLVEDTEWFYSEFDNYTKYDFIEYFTKKAREV